jgi:hypothetical protein
LIIGDKEKEMKLDEILKVTDKEVLVERLKAKDVRKVERRLIKRAIQRLEPKVLPAVIETAIPVKVRKPRVKKVIEPVASL